MTKLRLIGDIHTDREKYLSLIEGAEYSLQVGDLDILGFEWLVNNKIDSDKHKFIGGNHDNYDNMNVPHNLGDFGVWSVPNFGDIFFVRGAWSIDQRYRTIGMDWWPEEELSVKQCEEAIALYAEVKPKILVSHACPTNIVKHLVNPQFAFNMGFTQSIIRTKTDAMLHSMLVHHLPRLHIFGHYHKKFDAWIDGRSGEYLPDDIDSKTTTDYTHYVCLPINGVIELDGDNLDL